MVAKTIHYCVCVCVCGVRAWQKVQWAKDCHELYLLGLFCVKGTNWYIYGTRSMQAKWAPRSVKVKSLCFGMRYQKRKLFHHIERTEQKIPDIILMFRVTPLFGQSDELFTRGGKSSMNVWKKNWTKRMEQLNNPRKRTSTRVWIEHGYSTSTNLLLFVVSKMEWSGKEWSV